MAILETLNSPSDIKKLSIHQLNGLAEEIRNQILSVTEKNGGHLASNLGIVETTIALYYTFDFPTDKIIFDVGHQCYAHKILSDRKNVFSTIRTDGGISGFPDREESPFDAFIAGHAGTSLSAGIGYCNARDINGENYKVINVVGDGSFTNGLNLEALAVSSEKPKNYFVILNDNGMSISKNKNGLYGFISKRTTKGGYIRSKRIMKKIFKDSFVAKFLSRFKGFIKRVVGKDDYFEKYGFKYVGVVDGNDVKKMVKILSGVKDACKDKAIILHVKTTKGKGYQNAEEHADLYHGVGANLLNESGDMSSALGEGLTNIAQTDDKIVAITAAMKDGTGLSIFEKKFPKRFYDVGIAEEYAVTSAAGMAAGGLKPFVCVYSTFMQRAYDQIMHDVCLQNLPVVLCLDRAGLVGKDGRTHQGVFDLSYLTHLPNMTIIAPTSVEELKDALSFSLSLNSPCAIRYPKNSCQRQGFLPFKEGKWEELTQGDNITVLVVGPKMLELALKISSQLDGVSVVNARIVKPLDTAILDKIKDTVIVTLEENSIIGGFGALVNEYYQEKNYKVNLIIAGVKDKFIRHGSVDRQLEDNELTVTHLIEKIKNRMKNY